MNHPVSISPIPAFRDNYIWALHNTRYAVVVDPGDAEPVFAFLRQHGLDLAAILVTHHHHDHTSGIADLTRTDTIPVYGPASESITGVRCPVSDNQSIHIPELDLQFDVLAVPGHTSGHVAYHTPGHLFCGDVLFGCGCGRIFEGTPQQMYASLQRLAHLPPKTLFYSAHEYTLGNIAFALTLEPDNPDLVKRARNDRDKISRHLPTLPGTIAAELATNPFLRCNQPVIVRRASQASGRTELTDAEVFAILRTMKNEFR